MVNIKNEMKEQRKSYEYNNNKFKEELISSIKAVLNTNELSVDLLDDDFTIDNIIND